MKRLQRFAVVVACAGLATPVLAHPPRHSKSVSHYEAAGAQQRISGTVSTVDSQRGLVTLASPDGTVKLHFPPRSLRNVDDGDRITAQYSLAKADRSTRAYDAPSADDEHFAPYDTSRGKTGGAGTTHDLTAAGKRYSRHSRAYDSPSDSHTVRGRTGGAGTTHDLCADGERHCGRTHGDVRDDDVARGPTGGAGTTQDTLAGTQHGEHYMSGRITKLDRQAGIVRIQTGEATLQLRFPSQELREFDEGDDITVRMAFARRA